MDPRQDSVGFYTPFDFSLRRFEDRADAGAFLARHLEAFRGTNALVLGIPRGGVPVAFEVARALDADLDVLVARKLGAPGQEELAIGAVTSSGARFLNEEIIRLLGVPASYVDRLTADKREEARARERRFRAGRPPLETEDRVGILVDDGLATGATMRAAIRGLREARADRIVVAVPVGSREACEAIEGECDELVCPEQPEPFLAVGAHYRSFPQTSDEEVEQILRSHHEQREAR